MKAAATLGAILAVLVLGSSPLQSMGQTPPGAPPSHSSDQLHAGATPPVAPPPAERSSGGDGWGDWLRSSGPADWLLVLVGGLGIRAALRTLRAVEKQADAAATSASAAKDGAEAALTQARLAAATLLELKDASVFRVLGRPGTTSLRLEYTLFNPTRNPAAVTRITRQWGIVENGAVTGQHDANAAYGDREMIIAPGKGCAFSFEVGPLDQAQSARWSDGKLPIRLTLTVTYTDPLGIETTRNLTRLCFVGPKYVASRLPEPDLPLADDGD